MRRGDAGECRGMDTNWKLKDREIKKMRIQIIRRSVVERGKTVPMEEAGMVESDNVERHGEDMIHFK